MSALDGLLAFTDFQAETHQPYYLHVLLGAVQLPRRPRRRPTSRTRCSTATASRCGRRSKLSLKEALAPEEVAAEERASSPDLYQTWLVNEGDTLDAIAARVYGSPAFWRPIAAANRLGNPRALVAGQVLTLPPRLD